MVQETGKTKRLLISYGENKGSMSFSNVNPDADFNAILNLAIGINELQILPAQSIVCVTSTTLEAE